MVIQSIDISPGLISDFEWYLGDPRVVGKPIKEKPMTKDKTTGVPKVSVGTNKGAHMTLCVLDRMVIPNMCPKEGTLEDHRCAKSITDKILLEQDEATDVAMTTREGRISWNKLRDFDREFHFTTREMNFLKQRVKQLDAEKRITYDMLGVCEKIEKAKLEKSRPHGKVA